MNVLWETMIAEMRAQRLELDNRRHFTPENTPIEDSRAIVDDLLAPARPIDVEIVAAKTAMNLKHAAEANLFEVG